MEQLTEDRNSHKESSILPVNNLHKDAAISPVKNIQVVAGKNDNAAEKQDTLNKLLIGIAIAILCQYWYIWSLYSTISEKKVESIIQRCIEDRYGPLFEESLKNEVDKFRSCDLITLELDINNTKENVAHLDTAIQEIETKLNDLHGLVENVSSYLNTLELNITTVNETVWKIDTGAHELQTKIENTEKYLNEQLETARKSLTRLDISFDALDSRLKHNQSLADALGSLQTKYEEKIEPNLFNKGSLLLALMLLFLLMLIMMVSQYRLYQLIRGAQPVQRDRSQYQTERVSS